MEMLLTSLLGLASLVSTAALKVDPLSLVTPAATHLGAVSFKGCGLAHDKCGQAGRARGSGSPRRASRTLE